MLGSNRIAYVAIGGLALALAVIGVALFFQPGLEDTPEPSREAQAEAQEQAARYNASVTCNQDCKIQFDFGEAAEAPSAKHDAASGNKDGNGADDWQVILDRSDLLAQKRMAYWAIWLAALTAIGVVLIAGTFWEAMDATKAANAAATAAADQTKANNRPRLRVGIITASTDNVGAIEAGKPLHCDVGIVNIGRSAAQIYSSFCMRYVGHHLPMYRPYSDRSDSNLFKEIETLHPGVAAHASIDLPALDQDEVDRIHTKRTKLFIMGWVRYKDDGISRRTMFCRELDPVAKRFRPTEDPDYEVEN